MSKATTTSQVRLSSFTAELDGLVSAIKSSLLIKNILAEIGIKVNRPVIKTDNEALKNFVNGDRVAKGVRHMELRMWFAQEQVKCGNIEVVYMEGKKIPADKLTKVSSIKGFEDFRYILMGTYLLCDENETKIDEKEDEKLDQKLIE